MARRVRVQAMARRGRAMADLKMGAMAVLPVDEGRAVGALLGRDDVLAETVRPLLQ